MSLSFVDLFDFAEHYKILMMICRYVLTAKNAVHQYPIFARNVPLKNLFQPEVLYSIGFKSLKAGCKIL